MIRRTSATTRNRLLKLLSLSFFSFLSVAFLGEKYLTTSVQQQKLAGLLFLGLGLILWAHERLRLFRLQVKISPDAGFSIGLANASRLSRKIEVCLEPKGIAVFCLVLLVSFNLFAGFYSPIRTIKKDYPEWWGGLPELVDFVGTLNKSESYFLMIEDPGLKYYGNVKVYELTDTYGAIRLQGLLDFPEIQGIFFGKNEASLKTQKVHSISGNFENVNLFEAVLDHGSTVWIVFSDLLFQRYYIVVNHDFGGNLYYEDSLGNRGRFDLDYNSGWKTTVYELDLGGQAIVRIENGQCEGSGGGLRSVLLIPKKTYNATYDYRLRNVLRDHNIRFVVVSQQLLSVWVYSYYSLFAYLYMPISETTFNIVYQYGAWSIYELRS